MSVALRSSLMARRRAAEGLGRSAARPLLAALAAFVAAAPLALLGNKLRDPGFVPIRHVAVQGEFRRVDPGALEARLAPLVQGGFFSVNLPPIREAIEDEPWIDRVSIRRTWPPGLSLRVTEQVAVARWSDDELLNRRGERFPAAGAVPEGLATLRGPQGKEREMLETLARLDALLAPLGRRVAELVQDERRSWSLRLDDGVELRLGRARVEERLRSLVTFYPALWTQAAEPARVDLRYTNGFAVAWKEQAREGSGP